MKFNLAPLKWYWKRFLWQPHSTSDAGVGFYCRWKNQGIDKILYGSFDFGFFFGRFMLTFENNKFKFCTEYATGCGG